MKVWITRYAITEGIFSVEAEISNGMACYRRDGRYQEFAHGKFKDWHPDFDSALLRAEELKLKKIQSLENSMKKIKALKFGVEVRHYQ